MTALLLFLRREWLPLLSSVLIAGGIWWGVSTLRASGYREGAAARDAYWQPKFTKAENDKAAADARADAAEAASRGIRADLEETHAQVVKNLEGRTAAAGVRMAGLLRELAACSHRQQVSPVAGDDGSDARAAEIDRRAGEIGAAIAAVGRDCAIDASVIRDWQSWDRRNAALRASAIPE